MRECTSPPPDGKAGSPEAPARPAPSAAGAVPPGFVHILLEKGCVLVLPERVYLAGLKLGKTLRRRQALRRRGERKEP